MFKGSWFDKWNNKQLPQNIQKQIDGFARATGMNNTEQIFRAGFYIGKHLEELKREMGEDAETK